MSLSSIHVFAPATIANLSVGFDVLGLALDQPGDEVILRKNNSGKISISKIIGDGGKLPLDPTKNTVGSVIIDYLKQRNLKFGVDIELYKKMPFGSGLGSSSASAVAGLVAINELSDNPLSRNQLIPFAMEGERVACGNAHADNVAPALLGGVTLIKSYQPLDIISLPFPDNLYIGLIYQPVHIATSDARDILPKEISLKMATQQWGYLGGLIAGFCMKNIDLIGKSMQDNIIEPVRSQLIPHFKEMKNIALNEGALSFGISGSGPTVFLFSDSEVKTQNIVKKLEQMLKEKNQNSTIYISKINPHGAVIL